MQQPSELGIRFTKHFQKNVDEILRNRDSKMTKKKDKSSLSFLLEGQVSLVERDKEGKELVTPLDGKVVLKCLIHCLTEGMDLLEEKQKK